MPFFNKRAISFAQLRHLTHYRPHWKIAFHILLTRFILESHFLKKKKKSPRKLFTAAVTWWDAYALCSASGAIASIFWETTISAESEKSFCCRFFCCRVCFPATERNGLRHIWIFLIFVFFRPNDYYIGWVATPCHCLLPRLNEWMNGIFTFVISCECNNNGAYPLIVPAEQAGAIS